MAAGAVAPPRANANNSIPTAFPPEAKKVTHIWTSGRWANQNMCGAQSGKWQEKHIRWSKPCSKYTQWIAADLCITTSQECDPQPSPTPGYASTKRHVHTWRCAPAPEDRKAAPIATATPLHIGTTTMCIQKKCQAQSDQDNIACEWRPIAAEHVPRICTPNMRQTIYHNGG